MQKKPNNQKIMQILPKRHTQSIFFAKKAIYFANLIIHMFPLYLTNKKDKSWKNSS
jgi:hypothetical protein